MSPARWRYIACGLGVSSVASAVLLTLWLLSPSSPAAAMERLAKALDQVSAFSYRMESVYVSRKNDGRTVRTINVGRWQAEPLGLHSRVSITETLGANSSAGPHKLLGDLEETHRSGARGIVIDHLKKEYWWTDEELDAADIPGGSPLVVIFKVRQRRGRVLRNLGMKKIDGSEAEGFEIQLDGTSPESDLGIATPESGIGQAKGWDWRNVHVEVWIDPDTNLPLLFQCTRRGDDFETTYRFTEVHWNIDSTADAFDASVPDGYTKIQKSQ